MIANDKLTEAIVNGQNKKKQKEKEAEENRIAKIKDENEKYHRYIENQKFILLNNDLIYRLVEKAVAEGKDYIEIPDVDWEFGDACRDAIELIPGFKIVSFDKREFDHGEGCKTYYAEIKVSWE